MVQILLDKPITAKRNKPGCGVNDWRGDSKHSMYYPPEPNRKRIKQTKAQYHTRKQWDKFKQNNED